jgi:hypothetical protein
VNLLVDRLPTTVEIDGREYPINSDFRSCLRIILAFEDPDLAGIEKQLIMLANIYPEQPENVEAAIRRGLQFLNGGANGKEEDEEEDLPLRLYSFAKDANLIYAAFRQTHGIDLTTARLHWFEFLALFMDLGKDTTFCGLVNLRQRVKTHKADKSEREAARELGEMFDVPEIDTRTLEERDAEDEFNRLIEAR